MPHILEQDEKTDNCKLKICNKREKRIPVFITDFSHGQVNINYPSKLKFQCFKKDTDELKEECEVNRYLVAASGRLNYTGSSNVSSLRYLVGVRDKITGKMKLYDCVLFRMKPALQIVNRNIQPMPKTYKEKLDMLTKSFGSKARKRVLSLKQKSTVDTTLVKETSVSNSDLQPFLNKSMNDDMPIGIDYLPPLNRVASSVNDVFNIRHIISSEEDTSLNMEVQEFLTAPLDKFTKKRFSFCKYVSVRLENQLKYTDMRKKDPTPNIPDPYKKNMLQKFTVISTTNSGKTTRLCSSQLKDKLVSYIFVLCLFIDGYIVNLEEIAREMSNIKVPKLTTVAESLGCYISKKKIGEQLIKYAELKIPLNVPIPKYARRSSFKKL